MYECRCDGKSHIKPHVLEEKKEIEFVVFITYPDGVKNECHLDLCEEHRQRVVNAIQGIVNCEWEDVE